jgi:hypothetical protein
MEVNMSIAENFAQVRQQVAEAARRSGRAPEDITIVAVSKTVGLEQVEEAIAAGVTDFGENRPDQLMAKADAFPLSAFNDEPFILTLPGRNSDTEQLLERHNIHPHIKFTTVDSFATYSMVEEGLGVSINNDLIAKNWKGRVKVLPLDPPQPLHLGILVPSLSAASPAARKCIQCVQQVLPTLV